MNTHSTTSPQGAAIDVLGSCNIHAHWLACIFAAAHLSLTWRYESASQTGVHLAFSYAWHSDDQQPTACLISCQSNPYKAACGKHVPSQLSDYLPSRGLLAPPRSNHTCESAPVATVVLGRSQRCLVACCLFNSFGMKPSTPCCAAGCLPSRLVVCGNHAIAGDARAHLACCTAGDGGAVLFSSAMASAAAMPLRMAPSALELRQKSPQAPRRRPGSVKQGSPSGSALKALAQRCARRYVGSGSPSAQQEGHC